MDNIIEYKIINKNKNTMQKLKFTSLNILKLNNKIYLPYQLHQLPKWFNKYNTNFISIKGYTYILLEDHIDQNPYFNFKNFKEKLVFHKSYNYKQSR